MNVSLSHPYLEHSSSEPIISYELPEVDTVTLSTVDAIGKYWTLVTEESTSVETTEMLSCAELSQ